MSKPGDNSYVTPRDQWYFLHIPSLTANNLYKAAVTTYFSDSDLKSMHLNPIDLTFKIKLWLNIF